MMQPSAAAPNRVLLPSLAVAICGAMWGGFWIPLRWFEDGGTGGGWVSFIFFAVSALAPLPWVWGRVSAAALGQQIITGTLLGSAFTLYTVSLVMTDVLHAILLFYMTPVWSTLAGIALFGERLTVNRTLAMVMGFAGLACILGLDEGLPLPRNAGDWLALASGMLWAAGTLRSFRSPSEGIALPVFAFSLGGLLSSAVMLALSAGTPLAMAHGVPGHLPWIVLFALIIFVPPNFLVLWAAQRIDSGRVGILMMTEVLAGTVTAALFSGEPFGALELTGTVLIVCAGLIEVLGRR